MAGIYIHIPFCKSKCAYCSFYSVANISQSKEVKKGLLQELKLQKDFFCEDDVINTIYFGGGTPSFFHTPYILEIIDYIFLNFKVITNPEITLECNPDDINIELLTILNNHGKVNRISMGLQSFYNPMLKFLNRRHHSGQSISAVELAKSFGFSNISIDLIYGLPGLSAPLWKEAIQQALELDVPHISAYALSIEEGSGLFSLYEQGKLHLPDDNTIFEQYKILVESLQTWGYQHYEISNFALSGKRSRHNASYWKSDAYLGIGPSAHSYKRNKRFWNVADINKYLEHINRGKLSLHHEVLDDTAIFNEYIMKSLRTCDGIDLNFMRANFPVEYVDAFYKNLKSISEQYFEINDNKLAFNLEGLFISNSLIAELFVI